METPMMKLRHGVPGVEIHVKREDLLPFSFGGNKLRIGLAYLEDLEARGFDCLIGRGNPRSNLCRVLASLCAARGIPCHIVSPADEDGSWTETHNSRLVRMAGAVYHPCPEEEVPAVVEGVMARCREEGLRPYYIFGDPSGRGNEAVPVRAYAEAYGEILRQAGELGFVPDCICHASGGGMTQAGLAAGQALAGGRERILGISVYAGEEELRRTVEDYAAAYLASINREAALPRVEVRDGYLAGGYGRYSPKVAQTIREVYAQNGLALDPVYTGKAFLGLLQELRREPGRHRQVIFLHTGGLPLFFDRLPELVEG